jgi:ubiquitin C-terminal hydrolase
MTPSSNKTTATTPPESVPLRDVVELEINSEDFKTEEEARANNERALHFKSEGNKFFQNKEYGKAATAYSIGLTLNNSQSKSLEVDLRSNLAMTYLKLEKYEAVQEHCSKALGLDPSKSKLWYRRALAYESMYKYELAISDLHACLELLGQDADISQVAQGALERISKRLLATSESNSNYDNQRQTVLTLLEARRNALHPEVTKEGEAFFLLSYDWWQRWCSKVNFFPKYNGDKSGPREVLAFLPPGAVCPNLSEVSEMSDLGPIDNSQLLVDKSNPLVHHWFFGEKVRPNLVRGFHYELIPREVYQALVSWYGELSNAICRRANSEGFVPLYGIESCTPTFFNKCGACRAPHAKSRCMQCLAVHYCNRACQESHWAFHKSKCGSIHEDRGGKVGFQNLGNTCFMNSALQCLSHATPLTRHFLSNCFLNDLNVQNPLGTGGKLAHAYDQVMREVWMAGPPYMSPSTLKRAIAMFAPRFVGCSQHDAQEFLAYLLDGLHEDLNRIRCAPYLELPDVNENSDMEIAGEEAWNAHKRRNDSLVMDTFYGQFKSTCVCPRCHSVSVSFDAFNHVSLEIPQPQSNRFIPVLIFSKDGSIPQRWMVEVPRGSLVLDLRKALSGMCGIRADRLALCDVFDFIIYEIINDNKNINSIRYTDVIAAFDVDSYTSSTMHTFCTHCTISSEGKRERFGFPFHTSCPAEYTCKQVFQHLWQQIKFVPDIKEDWVEVCLTDDFQKPLTVFPGNSAYVPKDSDEKLINYLSVDCTERFLFFWLEWKDVPELKKVSFVQVKDHTTYVQGVQKERSFNSSRTITLDQCFQTFTRPERLDENNKWYCKRCKDHVRAMKTMELWRLPNVLIIHLKRFEFKHALRRDKLDTFVDFNIKGLDMANHMSKCHNGGFVHDKIPSEYDLFAVTNHYGKLGFGHYTAFARSWDEKDGMSVDWALFDDASVRVISEDQIVTPAAYVLFYRRRQFT